MTEWKKFDVERVDHGELGVVVYRLGGVLTSSDESYEFLDQLRDEVRKGHLRIVMNLERVEHVTSAGVGIIAACYTSLTNAGGQLCLAAVPRRARTILDVVRLLEIMRSATTEEEAIRALAA